MEVVVKRESGAPQDFMRVYAAQLASLDELRGLPPALVVVSENDILRDEGEAYAQRLMQAGVETACIRYNGTIHDFVMVNALARTPQSRAAVAAGATALRHAFHG